MDATVEERFRLSLWDKSAAAAFAAGAGMRQDFSMSQSQRHGAPARMSTVVVSDARGNSGDVKYADTLTSALVPISMLRGAGDALPFGAQPAVAASALSQTHTGRVPRLSLSVNASAGSTITLPLLAPAKPTTEVKSIASQVQLRRYDFPGLVAKPSALSSPVALHTSANVVASTLPSTRLPAVSSTAPTNTNNGQLPSSAVGAQREGRNQALLSTSLLALFDSDVAVGANAELEIPMGGCPSTASASRGGSLVSNTTSGVFLPAAMADIIAAPAPATLSFCNLALNNQVDSADGVSTGIAAEAAVVATGKLKGLNIARKAHLSKAALAPSKLVALHDLPVKPAPSTVSSVHFAADRTSCHDFLRSSVLKSAIRVASAMSFTKSTSVAVNDSNSIMMASSVHQDDAAKEHLSPARVPKSPAAGAPRSQASISTVHIQFSLPAPEMAPPGTPWASEADDGLATESLESYMGVTAPVTAASGNLDAAPVGGRRKSPKVTRRAVLTVPPPPPQPSAKAAEVTQLISEKPHASEVTPIDASGDATFAAAMLQAPNDEHTQASVSVSDADAFQSEWTVDASVGDELPQPSSEAMLRYTQQEQPAEASVGPAFSSNASVHTREDGGEASPPIVPPPNLSVSVLPDPSITAHASATSLAWFEDNRNRLGQDSGDGSLSPSPWVRSESPPMSAPYLRAQSGLLLHGTEPSPLQLALPVDATTSRLTSTDKHQYCGSLAPKRAAAAPVPVGVPQSVPSGGHPPFQQVVDRHDRSRPGTSPSKGVAPISRLVESETGVTAELQRAPGSVSASTLVLPNLSTTGRAKATVRTATKAGESLLIPVGTKGSSLASYSAGLYVTVKTAFDPNKAQRMAARIVQKATSYMPALLPE